MYCEHCGEKIPEYSRFCEQCGKPVTSRSAPSPQSPAPYPMYGSYSPSSKMAKTGKNSDYSRIALWIRERYGSRLAPGMDASQLRGELETVFKSEQARGIPVKALKGFRSYIDQQQYANLIQPRR